MLRTVQLFARALPPQSRSYCFEALNQQKIHVIINGIRYNEDDWLNSPPKILSAPQRQLYKQEKHPLCHLQKAILDHLKPPKIFDDLNPIVTTAQNFDSLSIAANDKRRRRHQCFYVNQNQMFRSHLAAHYADLFAAGQRDFVVVGDVYRRSCPVDPLHYSVFHQLDRLRVVDGASTSSAADELRTTLDNLITHLFNSKVDRRWVECESTVAVTKTSWHLELPHNGKFIKVLRSGLIEEGLLGQGVIGWNFSIGLERLAMALFGIPDIRLLSLNLPDFLVQFKNKRKVHKMRFEPYVPAKSFSHDVSFWLADATELDDFCMADLYDLVRSVGGINVEQVELYTYDL